MPKNRTLHIYNTNPVYDQSEPMRQPQAEVCMAPNAKVDPAYKPWPRAALGADNQGLDGRGVNIALFDSGVSPHGELNGKVDVLDMTGAQQPGDTYGHGSAIAGILVGNGQGPEGFKSIAPGAKVKSYKITYYERNREGREETKTNNIYIEQAVLNVLEYNKYRAGDRIDIINISYGLTDQNKMLEDVLKRAYDSGITIVAGAGNSSGAVQYPAAYNFIIAAGAITPQRQIYPASNTGAGLDFMGPGEYIFAPSIGGGYCWIGGGTSYSAAYISGVAALIIQAYQEKYQKKPTPQEVYAIMTKISAKLPSVSENKQGRGMPDVSKIPAAI